MRNFKRLIFVLILLFVASAVVVFVLENQLAAELRFLGWALPSLPISVYVLMSLCAGLVLGALVGASQFRVRRRTGKDA